MIKICNGFKIKVCNNDKNEWNSISVLITHLEEHPPNERWSWLEDESAFEDEQHAMDYGEKVVDIICRARGLKRS